jgi:adenosylcobinamide-phosphate synthase
MCSITYLPAAAAAGYFLDLIFGDPVWFPHPVKAIGWFIVKLEPVFRRIFRNEKTAGIFFTFLIVGMSCGVTFAVVYRSFLLNAYAGLAVSAFLIYTSLSIKDLKVESIRVYRALKNKDIVSARRKLAKIVGRDTGNLNDEEIIRAVVETIAENTVDGILSPLFYAFIGGAPLALAYKAINTLDSMTGYRNEKYRDFGWASAKLDDMANFIPARISIILLPLACAILGKCGINSIKIIFRDRKKNPSPNSGIPESAIAGAFGIQLGGTNFYNSNPVTKPFIGDNKIPMIPEHITESIKISYICSALALTAGLLAWYHLASL